MAQTYISRRPRLDHYLTPFRHLAWATGDGLALLCEVLTLSPFCLDRLDERLARARREAFGRRAWLLSWHREPDGSWRARLSGPDLERTVERTARTRACAVRRTARAAVRIRAYRARLGKTF